MFKNIKNKIKFYNNAFIKKSSSSGFAILYTVLIIALIVGVSVGVVNLITQEKSLSRIAKDSLAARVSADVGMECMLYKDKMPTAFDPNVNPLTFFIDCGRDNFGNGITYQIDLASSTASGYTYNITARGSVTGPCFKSYLQRDLTTTPITTKIDIYGYNICDSTSPQRVERGIIAEY